MESLIAESLELVLRHDFNRSPKMGVYSGACHRFFALDDEWGFKYHYNCLCRDGYSSRYGEELAFERCVQAFELQELLAKHDLAVPVGELLLIKVFDFDVFGWTTRIARTAPYLTAIEEDHIEGYRYIFREKTEELGYWMADYKVSNMGIFEERIVAIDTGGESVIKSH